MKGNKMPIIEPKIALALEAALISEMSSAFADPAAPADQSNSHKKMAGAIAKAVAKVLAETLLSDAKVMPGIPTAGSPAAQVTTGPGSLF